MKLFPEYKHHLIFGKDLSQYKDRPYTVINLYQNKGVMSGRNIIVRLLRRIKKLNHE